MASSQLLEDMDTRTFIVELVKALAWPIATLVILLTLRKQLIGLLRSLRRFKYGDAEAEFAEGLKEVAPQLPPAATAPVKRELQQTFGSPEMAIISAWTSIERQVLELGAKLGTTGRSLHDVLRQLQDKGIITEKDYDAMNGLRALRNLVAHREEPSVSPQKAAEYLAMADAVKMLLEQAARKA
jgi:Domain of unknown function (DUF4145)